MFKRFLALALAAASLAFAGEYWNNDAVTMKFLSMTASARSAAMSGAGVADAGRVSEVSRNPLAMSTAAKAEIGLNQIVFDEANAGSYTSVYYGLPFWEKYATSFAIEYLGYDDLKGYDDDGNPTSEFGAYAWALQAGLGSKNKVFNWAFSGRFASQTIDDETGYLFAGDLGGSFRVNRYLAFATTLTNAGYATKYIDEKNYPPMALQAGLTGTVPFGENWALHLSADAYRRADTDPQWLFGGELSFYEILYLRGGYAIRPDTEDGISAGLGLAFGAIVFDYGYSPRKAYNGGNHLFTLGMKF